MILDLIENLLEIMTVKVGIFPGVPSCFEIFGVW